MPRRVVSFVPGCCYHVYNRGVAGELVVMEAEDYSAFLRGFRRFLDPSGHQVLAYCLMPNHYHLLLRAGGEDLSRAMQGLGMSSVNALNSRLHRSGPLFQSRFRAKAVLQDRYLLHLSRYLHLNPVEAGLVNRPEDWLFSSYRDYVGLRKGRVPRPGFILDILATGCRSRVESVAEYRSFVENHAIPRGCPSALLIDSG